jgi:hypothetical protein
MNKFEFFQNIQLANNGAVEVVAVSGMSDATITTPGSQKEFFEQIQLDEDGKLKIYIMSNSPAVICDGWKQAYAHSFSFPSTYSYIDCNGMPQEISIENYDDTTIFCAIGTPVFIGGAIDVLENIGTCPL